MNSTRSVWQCGCLAVALGLLAWGGAREIAAAANTREGVALAIVYDTSGSMLEQVKDGSGNRSPKYRVANRALESIIQRLQAVASGGSSGIRRPLECGLIVFKNDHAAVAVPFGAFDADAWHSWLKGFALPQGSTPLGEAVRLAGQKLLASDLPRKHVLILTDGMNTRGPDPVAVIPKLKEDAARRKTGLSYHFVAFDVDAGVFGRVKKLGATVVGAADEKQLNSQLQFILEEKILLEEEEPPSVNNKQQ